MAGCNGTNGTNCHANGTCFDGWTGVRCKVKCTNGYYGRHCAFQCYLCLTFQCSCDHVTGACDLACQKAVMDETAMLQSVLPAAVGGGLIILTALFVVMYVWRTRSRLYNEPPAEDGPSLRELVRSSLSQSPHTILGTYSPAGAILHNMAPIPNLQRTSRTLQDAPQFRQSIEESIVRHMEQSPNVSIRRDFQVTSYSVDSSDNLVLGSLSPEVSIVVTEDTGTGHLLAHLVGTVQESLQEKSEAEMNPSVCSADRAFDTVRSKLN